MPGDHPQEPLRRRARRTPGYAGIVAAAVIISATAGLSFGSVNPVSAKSSATTTAKPAAKGSQSTARQSAVSTTTLAKPATPPKPTAPPKPLSARTAVKEWDSITDDEWPSTEASLTARAHNRSIEVYRTPDDRNGVLAFIAGRSVAGPVHFLALGMVGDWVRVAVPLRPNGTVGWVRKSDVLLIQNSYRVVIDLGTNRMKVYEGSKVLIDALVASGTGGTPTPTGLFFLKELVPQGSGGSLGPYAFGLSGYSDVLTNFNGGEGTIGVHGTNNPGKLGSSVSHGCVRVDNANIIMMAKTLPLGTPVEVHRALSDAPTKRKTIDWAFGGAAAVPAAKAPTAVVEGPTESATTTPSLPPSLTTSIATSSTVSTTSTTTPSTTVPSA